MVSYDKLVSSVVKDLQGKDPRGCKYFCDKCEKSLSDYAESGTECGHSCEFCSKYKWAIDRAKHYGEKLGIHWKDIMKSWEEDRRYWYMNYYQECNQPLIDSKDVFVFESVNEMRERVGKEFICPCCKGISTDPYECNSGVKMEDGKTCDWKSYGLFQFGLALIYCKKERKSTKCFIPKALIESEE